MPRSAASRCWSARLDREVRAALRTAEEAQDQAQRAERALSRTGSLHRGAGRRLRARSPSPPTWPAAAPTSSLAAMPTCASATNWAASSTRPNARSAIAQIRAEVAADKEKVHRRGRPLHRRHRTARKPAHRQPAARPFRPPGRSGRLEILPQPAGRSDAHFRVRAHGFGFCTRLGLEKGEAITHPWVNKALEKAQQKVEARNFEIRKNILKYDNVLNDQRKVIFEQRSEIMSADDVERPDRRFPRAKSSTSWSPATSPKRPMPSSGTRRACKTKSRRSSASICRSSTGPRKKASPTKKCASAS